MPLAADETLGMDKVYIVYFVVSPGKEGEHTFTLDLTTTGPAPANSTSVLSAS